MKAGKKALGRLSPLPGLPWRSTLWREAVIPLVFSYTMYSSPASQACALHTLTLTHTHAHTHPKLKFLKIENKSTNNDITSLDSHAVLQS